MTDLEFHSWLRQGGGKVVLLAEVELTQTLRLSTVPYVTLPTDTPANTAYQAVLAGGLAVSESLSLSSKASLSVGDLEVHNEDGSLDHWLDWVWCNRAIRIYLGDASWPRADFRVVFSGVVSDIGSRRANRLNINMRDKLQRLNTPVSDVKLGGTGQNKDRLIPVTLGEVHNISPLVADAPNELYRFNNGPSERVIEVRDNGVPLASTSVTLSSGTIKLLAQPAGTITASVQGDTPYKNTVSALVQRLATSYGTPSERFTVADLDVAQLADFETTHPQPVGVYLPDKANVLQVCQDLANSVGASVAMSRQGQLRLLQLTLPPTGPEVEINPSDYEARSLEIAERSTVISAVKLGYCRNWTVQDNLETGIPTEHKDLFNKEWLEVVASSPSVAGEYRLTAEPDLETTYLLRRVDAEAEANRRLALWSTPRTVYRLCGYAHLLTLELGQKVRLRGSRFGLQPRVEGGMVYDGKVGVVIKLQLDWIARRATVEVLV